MSAIKRAANPNQPRRRARSRTRFVLCLGALLACFLFALLGMFAARPFVLAQRLRVANDRMERKMLAYRLQNQRAEKAVRSLSTVAGVEKAARSLGYIRHGEQKLRLHGSL